ncbi:putative ATP-dependent RNA helicase DDX27 [Styela clava]
MSDLIQTINDDDEVKVENEESESEEEANVLTKEVIQQKRRGKDDFNSKFIFDEDDAEENVGWTLNSAIEMAKSKHAISRSSLDQKIAEVRRNRLIKSAHFATKNNMKDNIVSNSQNVNEYSMDYLSSGSEEDETMLKPDKIRIKNKRTKLKDSDDINLDEEIKAMVSMKKIKQSTEDVLGDKEFFNSCSQWNPKLTFQDMNFSRPLLKGINALNYVVPTPIQQATIPVALLGKDICACAATGTGKTAAFMLPVLERLIYKPRVAPVTRVLCLVPTRELAVQVHAITRQIAQFTDVQVCLAAGGLDIRTQEAALRQGPDILIATPGRLIDHLHNTPSFQLESVEVLILDEADRMLDEFFAEQMTEIIRLCSIGRQTMLFSATMTDKVNELASVSLKNPMKLFVNSNTDVAPYLRQEFIRIRPNKEGDREAIVAALCSRTFVTSVLIFTQTKKQAHRMHIVLGLLGLKVAELHGDLNQSQRLESLQKFKNAQVDILICTDLAARGLDIENVKTVINFTMPNTHKHYVHRVGRTARAGKTGRSVSLVGETERKMLKEIVKQAKNPVRSRLVPPAVIEKYKVKLDELDEEVGEVLRMEIAEKEMIKSENQISKGQRLLGKKPNEEQIEKRNWFQSRIEREMIKAEKILGKHSEAKPGKKFVKGKILKGAKFVPLPKNAQERAARELEKVQAFQLREKKRNRKQKRARACAENVKTASAKIKKPKNKSSFASELTDTSARSVKKFRAGPSYEERKGFKGKQKYKERKKQFNGKLKRH